MRPRDLHTQNTLGDGVFPRFFRRAQSRHDVVAGHRLAIPFRPFLVAGNLVLPNHRVNQTVGHKPVSAFPALVPIVEMTDDHDGALGIVIKQPLDVPAVRSIAAFGQDQIAMKAPLAGRVPGSRQIGATQVNDVGAKLLHVVKVEDGVGDLIAFCDGDGVGWQRGKGGRHEIAQLGVVASTGFPTVDGDANGEQCRRSQRGPALPASKGRPARAQSVQESGETEPRGNRP